MSSKTVSNSGSDTEENASWLPMIVIAMGQMLMSFNVAALPVSMGGRVKCFDTAPFELFGVSPARLMIELRISQ